MEQMELSLHAEQRQALSKRFLQELIRQAHARTRATVAAPTLRRWAAECEVAGGAAAVRKVWLLWNRTAHTFHSVDVEPAKLLRTGYAFRHDDLEACLRHVLGA